ncbi:MAG: FAD binding domain-containing protein [Candidatus Caldarchaeum sp.]
MRSEVKRIGLLQPSTLREAVSLLNRFGDDAKVVAGGTDLMYLVKNGVRTHIPRLMVDISNLGLSYINFNEAAGLKIGATTHLSEIAEHNVTRGRFTVLAEAAERAASPQLRNMATIGGDLLQEVWCWYLRYNYDCWRNGGTICYGAIGDNRFYHSIFGGRLCYAVHPGDVAPALFALNARVVIASPSGEKTLTMDEFMPGIVLVDGKIKENVLKRNEILKEVVIPTPPAGTKSAFYKIAERGSIDFALASAAVVANISGSTVNSINIVLGGVDVKPRRAKAAEDFLRGSALNEQNIKRAADLAVQDAQPLTFGTGNAFRVEIARGAVTQALQKLA